MYIKKYYKVIRVIKDGDGGATPLYIENVSDSDGVFKLSTLYSPTYTPNLIYRIDNGEWFEYDVATLPSITVPSGSKIYFRGDNANRFNQGSTNFYTFTFSKSFNIGGYLTSLLALDNFNTITDISRYGFYNLFYQQSNLLNAEDLITDNIITVNDNEFAYCFDSCSSLTTAPTFENITTVSDNGFNRCFRNCTSLTTAPNFGNVTTVDGNGFASCFQNCSSLTTPPKFDKVTTVGHSGFGSCFSGCSSLTTAPTFENVTSVDYHGFGSCFSGCSSLTTPPKFDKVTTVVNSNSGFGSCFSGCSSLQVVYTPNITTWNTSIFSGWLSNVSPTGVMYKPTGLEIPTGTSGVPEGWSTADY